MHSESVDPHAPVAVGLGLPSSLCMWGSEVESDVTSAATASVTGAAICNPPPAVEPGTPMVLWCEADPTKQQEVMDALASHPSTRHRQVIYFQTPARFTRWLFEQPRGEVVPWALLITGWREAKPCAMAINAVRSGDTSQLRPDGKRQDLQQIFGVPGQRVETAIEAMIVVVGKSKDEGRVVQWARDSGHKLSQLDIHVASDTCTVQDVVARLGSATAVPKSHISL